MEPGLVQSIYWAALYMLGTTACGFQSQNSLAWAEMKHKFILNDSHQL